MDRQHWINLAYKLCFWEEEQVHGSQINQMNSQTKCESWKITSVPQISTQAKKGKKENTTKPQSSKQNTFIPEVPRLISWKWNLNCNNKMCIFLFLSHVKHLKL